MTFLEAGVHHHNGSNLFLFHEVEGFAGEEARVDRLRGADHAVTGSHGQGGTAMFFHEAAKVAIGEDSRQFAIRGCHRGHPEFLGGHFVESGGHRSFRRNARYGIARVHEMFHAKELFSEASGGMKRSEIVRFEAAAVQQRDGERVSHGHGNGGARRGSKIQGAGFFFDADVEDDFAGPSKRGFGVASEGDDRDFETLESLEKIENFRGFASIADGQKGVAAGQHPEIAMKSFCGMEKERRSAGAGKRGGNFSADEAGFAHPGDDNVSFAGEKEIDGMIEGSVEACVEVVQGLRFDPEDAASGVETHALLQRRTSVASSLIWERS